MTDIGVALIGHAFMGAVHSLAWRNAPRFFELPLHPSMRVLCGRTVDAARATRLGWAEHIADWRTVLDRDDVQLMDICTPGSSHAEIAIAALRAGKHVLCEKPLANTVAEAERMAEAAEHSGAKAMVAFNNRRMPAAALARQMVHNGRIGTIRHIRARYLQDWLADPEFPLTWRLRAEHAGSGALGDIGAHIVDLTEFLTGRRITEVSGLTETFVPRRPLPDGGGDGEVTVDDAAAFLARLDGGAIGSYEATRCATGRRNALRVELYGELGHLCFDLERLNELEFYDATQPDGEQGTRRIQVTEPEHPYLHAWWPPGHPLGYEHSFTHEVVDLLTAIADDRAPEPSFADGLHVQRVLDAVQRSAVSRSWADV